MDFLILIGQRNCKYEGEYAPEALEVIDSNGNDENPDFMIEKMAEYRQRNMANGEFDNFAVVTIRVPDAAIIAALYPQTKPISGQIV